MIVRPFLCLWNLYIVSESQYCCGSMARCPCRHVEFEVCRCSELQWSKDTLCLRHPTDHRTQNAYLLLWCVSCQHKSSFCHRDSPEVVFFCVCGLDRFLHGRPQRALNQKDCSSCLPQNEPYFSERTLLYFLVSSPQRHAESHKIQIALNKSQYVYRKTQLYLYKKLLNIHFQDTLQFSYFESEQLQILGISKFRQTSFRNSRLLDWVMTSILQNILTKWCYAMRNHALLMIP